MRLQDQQIHYLWIEDRCGKYVNAIWLQPFVFCFAFEFTHWDYQNLYDTYPIVCWVSILKRKQDAKLYIWYTHGFHPDSACLSGRWSRSKSPCVNAISHQSIPYPSQVRMKLRANTRRVHRHLTSTRVVKISCRKRSLRFATRLCSTLHSPDLSTTRRRNLVLPVPPFLYLLLQHTVKTYWCALCLKDSIR